MKLLRSSDARGQGRFPGLESRHTFSFGSYVDPANERVSVLRVLNDDRLAAGAGFPTHGHQDMEIVSYVLEGALAHRDSLGNEGAVRAGEMQVMSAGTGIRHSEFNGSETGPMRFLQIWILPDRSGHAPRWQQVDTAELVRPGGRTRLVAAEGSGAPMTIHQDAAIDLLRLTAGDALELDAPQGRLAYLHLTRGRARLDGVDLGDGDGVVLDGADAARLIAVDAVEALLFDLPDGPVVLEGETLEARAA
ncbi:MAG: pirin family protein [Pseudomonadales bacterium]|jgi:redox-sensitive bicupin YhaK (pirin superfamily)|nr:pirin family protein [Pseudomonadales bacterium]